MKKQACKRIEDAIQKQFVAFIRKDYPSVQITRIKNEGFDIGKNEQQNMVNAINDKKMGRAEAGRPDLEFQIDVNDFTYILLIELKTLNGKLTGAQPEWWAKFKPTANKKGYVCKGLLVAKEIFINWYNAVTNATKQHNIFS